METVKMYFLIGLAVGVISLALITWRFAWGADRNRPHGVHFRRQPWHWHLRHSVALTGGLALLWPLWVFVHVAAVALRLYLRKKKRAVANLAKFAPPAHVNCRSVLHPELAGVSSAVAVKGVTERPQVPPEGVSGETTQQANAQ